MWSWKRNEDRKIREEERKVKTKREKDFLHIRVSNLNYCFINANYLSLFLSQGIALICFKFVHSSQYLLKAAIEGRLWLSSQLNSGVKSAELFFLEEHLLAGVVLYFTRVFEKVGRARKMRRWCLVTGVGTGFVEWGWHIVLRSCIRSKEANEEARTSPRSTRVDKKYWGQKWAHTKGIERGGRKVRKKKKKDDHVLLKSKGYGSFTL